MAAGKSHGITWEVKKRGDGTLVIFEGQINERADFSGLHTLAGKVTFDLAAVRRLNSEGVRRWMRFVTRLDAVTELTWVRCSQAVVTQINLIRGFRGRATVVSFYAPYVSSVTGEGEDRLLRVEDVPDPLRPPVFPEEGGELRLDDLPDRYFAFLLDRDSRG